MINFCSYAGLILAVVALLLLGYYRNTLCLATRVHAEDVSLLSRDLARSEQAIRRHESMEDLLRSELYGRTEVVRSLRHQLQGFQQEHASCVRVRRSPDGRFLKDPVSTTAVVDN